MEQGSPYIEHHSQHSDLAISHTLPHYSSVGKVSYTNGVYSMDIDGVATTVSMQYSSSSKQYTALEAEMLTTKKKAVQTGIKFTLWLFPYKQGSTRSTWLTIGPSFLPGAPTRSVNTTVLRCGGETYGITGWVMMGEEIGLCGCHCWLWRCWLQSS